jgi:hypothetical protein
LYKAGSEVGSKHRIFTAMATLKHFGHAAVKRGYSPREFRGDWVTVHLPAGFLKQVDMWAHGRSCNDALNLFVKDG